MSERKEDGGPAYSTGNHDSGMTLRDHFASQVIIGGLEFPDFETAATYIGEPVPDTDCYVSMLEFSHKVEAFIRYRKADAMLEARK